MYGWTGKIVEINLTTGYSSERSTMDYAPLFVGGRGIAVRIYWDELPFNGGAFHADNPLIFMTGPLGGTPAPSASRWQIYTKSPLAYPEQFCYSNIGGHWGAELKFSGYDGIVIRGKSEKLVYIWIKDRKVEIRDASHIKGLDAIETQDVLQRGLGKRVRVLCTGLAGENTVRSATVLTESGASASSGFGAVMGSKNLKAIAVKGTGSVLVARPEELLRLRKYYMDLKLPEERTYPRGMLGTGVVFPGAEYVKADGCYGCGHVCRGVYKVPSGFEGQAMCQAAFFYQNWDRQYHKASTETAFIATKLADKYSIDTKDLGAMINWLHTCYKEGVITEKDADLPLGKIGSQEFIKTLLEKIAYRQGFGDILAEGTFRAANILGGEAKKLVEENVTKTGFTPGYGPRLYITTGLFYAVEPRQPIQHLHEISMLIREWVQWVEKGDKASYLTTEVIRAIARKFWGGELAADFSTYEGKALAAVKIQDRQYAKECLILCDFAWPLLHTKFKEDHLGDPTLESKIFSATTGLDVNEEELYKIGQRVFNLQRAVMLFEGHRGKDSDYIEEYNYNTGIQQDPGNPDCIMPGPEGRVISRKGMVVDRLEFEKMRDEYYELRGWDKNTGLQTKEKLMELNLKDVADALESRGLLSF